MFLKTYNKTPLSFYMKVLFCFHTFTFIFEGLLLITLLIWARQCTRLTPSEPVTDMEGYTPSSLPFDFEACPQRSQEPCS